MFLGFVKDMKFVPTTYVNTVFDVDYSKLYEKGIRLILTDLDNTLVSYKDSEVNERLLKWLEDRKRDGFEIIIISNNSSETRVKEFATKLGINYLSRAMKPFKFGFRKVLKKASRKYSPNEVVAIGDQLMTDVFAANRMNFTSVLVKAVDRKTEKWTTKFNRILEAHVLRKIEEKHPQLFEECLRSYKEENYGRN